MAPCMIKTRMQVIHALIIRWATRDYKYTSSVTAMLKDLNWHTLDQRRIDSRLLMMYKVTYDLVAIYPSTRVPYSKHKTIQTHSLFGLYIDRSIHSKTITGSHFSSGLSSTGKPFLPLY